MPENKVLTDYLQINDNIITYPEQKEFHCKSMGEMFFDQMLKYKNKIAQIDGITGEEQNYDYMLQKCIRTAIVMRHKGIQPNDTILICTRNHINTFVPAIASFFLGAKIVSIDPVFSLEEIAHIFQTIKPKLVFAIKSAIQLMNDASNEIGCTVRTVELVENNTDYSEYFEESEEEFNFLPANVDIEETAVIMLTSGTTGMPRGACLSHKTLLRKIIPQQESSNGSSVVQLIHSTPCWITGTISALTSLYNGNTILTVAVFDVPTIWDLIEKYKVAVLMLSPSGLNAVCNNPAALKSTPSLYCIWYSGGAIPEQQAKTLKTLLPNVITFQAYGLTELCGAVLTFEFFYFAENMKFLLQKPTSCGRPIQCYSYKIVDLDTEKALGPHEIGELCIKTNYQFKHFHNSDTTDIWDKDGFFKTGDLAYYDEDYCFFIIDRIKQMLKYRSYQVQPSKIESVLLTHPDIENALVIGIPHPDDMDHPMGIVVLKKTATIDDKTIEKYVNERVNDRYQLRAGVKIVDHIPLTPSTKIRRKYVKDMVLQGKL